jgi:serine/threonine protein kinase
MEEPQVGTIIGGRLHLRREIARGGMGILFEAKHAHLKSSVAVKTLHTEVLTSDVVRERLFREAEALAMVRDRGVVQVFDCGEDPRHGPFVVLEMLYGKPLDGILAARRTLTVVETVRLVDQLAQTLSVIHRKGVLHRDVKPSNIYVTMDHAGEVAKLVDFGIASLPNGSGRRKLTQHGAIYGTPEYMPPERLLGSEATDGRCDVYSLAATAYECLCGAPPFEGDCQQVMLQHARGERPALLNLRAPGVSLPVAHVIDRALAPDAAQRFNDVAAFASVLSDAAGVASGPLGLLQSVASTTSASRPTRYAPEPADVVHELVMRRKFARAPYLTPVRLLMRDDRVAIDGRSQDISEGGMQVLVAAQVPVGAEVIVKFALPLTAEVVATRAVVRWCKASRGGQFAIGLAFDGAVEMASSTVRRYVAWFGASADG